MLPYVAPVQETTASNGRPMSGNGGIRQQMSSPPRNLSLRLNSTYDAGGVAVRQQMQQQKQTEADAILGNVSEICDERTHLLNSDANPTPSPLIKRQNSNSSNSNSYNNNSFNLNNNQRSCRIVDGRDDCEDADVNVSIDNDETLSDDAITANEMTALDSDVSDRQSLHQNTVSNPRQTITTTTTKKQKLSKFGSNKTVGLKRVSFGSSKGSMVETLVFETPTPLSEHVEPSFGFGSEIDYKANMDDSGIEIQEESERSIVRVSIYQSSQPQQICPPEHFTKFDNLDNSLSNYNCNIEDIMTMASPIPGYDRQQSTDSGWDNPFRPGGDLSREADEIVKLISGGKPITPTEEHVIGNGKSQTSGTAINGIVVTEEITKSNVSQNQSTQNGSMATNGTHKAPLSTTTELGGAAKQAESNGITSSAQVSKQVVPGPTSASHVVIDEKKNKKKGCCVLQ